MNEGNSTLSVCVVADSVPPVIGGSQTSVSLFVQGLAARGVRVGLVSSNRPDAVLRQAVRASGGTVTVLDPCASDATWGSRVQGPSDLLSEILNENYDVVHAFSHATALSTHLALPVDDPPVFCASFHEMSSEHTDAGRRRSAKVYNLPTLSAVVPLADYFQKLAFQYCDAPQKIKPARQGVDLGALQSGSASLGREILQISDQPTIVYPGRWAPGKRQLDVVEMAHLLRGDLRAHGVAIRLVGAFSSVSARRGVDNVLYRAAVQDKIVDLGLTDYVRLIDDVPLSRMPHVYAAATAVVSASEQEALGFMGVEAMASGKPFVSTINDGVLQFCCHGVNSLLVPIGDVVGLAEACREVITSPATRQRLVANGRTSAAAFAYQHGVSDLLGIYRELLSLPS